jgi:hypothetical protein
MPMRKVGSETPTSDTAIAALATTPRRRIAA